MMPAENIIVAVGDTTVYAHTCGYKKQWCTVMLTELTDGKILPFIVFKT